MSLKEVVYVNVSDGLMSDGIERVTPTPASQIRTTANNPYPSEPPWLQLGMMVARHYHPFDLNVSTLPARYQG